MFIPGDGDNQNALKHFKKVVLHDMDYKDTYQRIEQIHGPNA